MNKLLLIGLLGAALVALSGAEVSSEEQSVAELSQLREVRAAEPGKGKGKGLKKRKGKNLKKSDKKGAGKNGARKQKKKARKPKKNGRNKKKKNRNGLKRKSSRNKNRMKKARKAAKKDENKDKKKNARKQKKKARKQKKKAKTDRKRKNNRKTNTVRTSTSCMDATCIDNAVKYMNQLKNKVKNFGKQYIRIATNKKQTTGKADKSSEFDPYLTKLRETGGGNTSNLLCQGKKNANLQTLYDNIATCKTSINDTCHAETLPTTNTTEMEACKATMDAFEAKTQEAIDLNNKTNTLGAESCVIWESTELATMSAEVTACDLKDHEKEHTDAKKACKKKFSTCRQEEDKVSKLVSACSASNTEEKVTAAIAQGKKNEAAATALSTKVNATLGSTGTAAATTAAGTTAGTTAAATAAGRGVVFRSTEVTCADFATK